MPFDSKYALNDAIRYLTKVAERRAAGGWVPPKEQERQQREAMRQEQQQALRQQNDEIVVKQQQEESDVNDFIKNNIKIDNPAVSHGAVDWLHGKIQQAEDAMAARPKNTASGKGLVGSTTAWGNFDLPTEMLSKLKGANDEQRALGDAQYDDLTKSVQKEGWNPTPILVSVNHKGEPYIVEGNTRVAVAKAMGHNTVPAEVKWLNGAENVQGDWHIKNFAKNILRTKKSNGGQILSKQFPTQYMPNVGRQVMADGGDADRDDLASNGKVKRHPALSISGTHIREETHGEPMFTGRL